SRPDIDWWARFNPSKSIEKLVKYWNHMILVSIEMPSGIVVFKVRAFRPDDARRIVASVLEISESLINKINDRMLHDALGDAQKQLKRASARLAHARIRLESARNESGILDVDKSAAAI